MFVRTAYKQDIFSSGTQITGIDICRYINPGQVTNVDGPVGIGQGRGYRVAFVGLDFRFGHVEFF
jgi:hypothetical protein